MKFGLKIIVIIPGFLAGLENGIAGIYLNLFG